MVRDVFGQWRARWRTSRVFIAGWQAALLMGSLLLPGCSGPPAAESKKGDEVAAATRQEDDDQCAVIVGSIHDTFQLKRLGQTTTISDGVTRLNDWQKSCAPALSGNEVATLVPEGMLTESQREALQSPKYTLRDGLHLQDCVLFRALAKHAFAGPDGTSTELERVVRGFDYVMRSVELVPRHPQGLPLTMYQICLLGKGTAADRAWIFASLLRQVKIDSVLITPSSSDPDSGDGPFLVGVLLDGKTYLFDPRLGLPIPPSRGEQPPSVSVATLEEAAGDPAVLKQLDAGTEGAYPITAASLEHPTVAIISDASPWSARMQLMQDNFTGEQAMVVSDPLGDTSLGAGLWSRVERAGGGRWSRDSMRIWSYPESQVSASMALSGDRQQLLAVIFSPFDAYFTLVRDRRTGQLTLTEQEQFEDRSAGKYDPAVGIRTRTTMGAQMRARLAHLSGDLPQAVIGYLEVGKRSRDVVGVGPPPAIKIMHERAVDDSSFWIALAKFEQGDWKVAIDWCVRYRKQQPRGSWLRPCRFLMAQSLAAQNDYAGAIAELEAVEPDDPQYAACRWLITQWRAREGGAG